MMGSINPVRRGVRRTWSLGLLVALLLTAPLLPAESRDEQWMLANGCTNCHGLDGIRSEGPIPSLAGLPEEYLFTMLSAYRSSALRGTIMNRAMEGYGDADLRKLSAYYAGLPGVPVRSDAAAPESEGQRLYENRCARCHDEQPEVPNVTGQSVEYLRAVMDDMRGGRREMSRDMAEALSGLDDSELQTLWRYLGGWSLRSER
ncbi:c-type cytochrome [Pseudomonas sp. LFM046]|uniref:c-type cytochrome n=1 Tax=Pseudomonas sp. LFM046 TaxID=1608357 RepID=UPI0005CFDC45|nr:c-type cytochrome [Pseudomonas sp. LFM046]